MTRKHIKLDGTTGEGGGQLVRVAVALAALTGTPIQIDHVRGNRSRGRAKRGGGLKAQHASCIKCLAEATNAELTGCFVGSNSFTFQSRLSPIEVINREMRVKAESAASILLVFQAVLPFLVFAGDEDGSAISITIQGGTNCSFSLSYEYLDQVLAPALERFGIKIERKLEFRGWSHGTPQVGSAKFIISPLRPGQALRNPNWPTEQGVITKIDVSILVPRGIQDTLKAALLFELNLVFPEVVVDFILVENSGHNARLYTLLVAHTSTGLRFGRDWLYDEKIKNKTYDQLAVEISQKVVDDLDNEIRKRGVVDEHLQDQLIIFQALSQGRSFIAENSNSSPTRISLVDQPENLTGDGSLHTTTARWVTRQLLPQVKWANQGTICEGVGWKVPAPKFIETPSENSDISDRVVA